MCFALPPQEIINIIGVCLRQVLLGNKKSNESDWRTLSNLENGKTKHLTPKTKTKLEKLYLAHRKKLYGDGQIPELSFDFFNVLDESPWNAVVQSINAGLKASGGAPLPTFTSEAIRLERVANTVRTLASRGNLRGAMEQIEQWELAGLPCVQSILAQIDYKKSAKQNSIILAPLLVITTLYLLACFSVDDDDREPQRKKVSILPELRGERLVRPMRRWLEALKELQGVRTNKELSKRLLASRSPDEDAESLQSLFDKWWQNGELVSWQRVPHLVSSLSKFYGEDNADQIKFQVYASLSFVRLMDGLLDLSIEIRDKLLSNYDALSPFSEYPNIRRYALEKKEALSSVSKR